MPFATSGAQRTQTLALRLHRLSPDTASTAQRYPSLVPKQTRPWAIAGVDFT
ncbi:hypothetical protein OIE50_09580 [Streptomyces canus]